MAELELDAQHYKKNSVSQYSQARTLLKLVEITRNCSILDVGCGHGHIIAELSQTAISGKSIGIDASKDMINLAKQTYQEHPYDNLQFFHMNAEDMKFEGSSFELVICTNVLMWVREPKKALELMISFLKNNGSIIIFTYPTNTPYATLFEEVLIDLYPSVREKSAVNTMLKPEEHEDILKNANMEMTLFDLEDITFFYENEDHFKNYVRGWLVCYAPLNSTQQELFIDELCKRAHQRGYYASSGKIAIPHKTLKIVAKKLL